MKKMLAVIALLVAGAASAQWFTPPPGSFFAFGVSPYGSYGAMNNAIAFVPYGMVRISAWNCYSVPAGVRCEAWFNY